MFRAIDAMVAENFSRVLEAFQAAGLTAIDLRGTWGYGYDDRGRDRLDDVVARAFFAEAGLLRLQWVSGTHALYTALTACSRPGGTVHVVSGPVYDTLERVVSDAEHPLGLSARGIKVSYVTGDQPQPPKPGDLVYIQRSRGYQLRPSWGAAEIRPWSRWAHDHGALVLVDNCYGEFTCTQEPTLWGADVVVGSLLKNPGGGIAPTGAYAAGAREWVERIAEALTAPGLGREIGPSGDRLGNVAQGLFLAPMMVGEALKGTAYAALLFQDYGFRVDPVPGPGDRNDIVVAIELGDPERVERFCAAVQRTCPIDSTARPEPWAMPGYQDPVIMAAGGFIPGGSLELSADAPFREPYPVYLQGGLTRWHTVLAAEAALQAVLA